MEGILGLPKVCRYDHYSLTLADLLREVPDQETPFARMLVPYWHRTGNVPDVRHTPVFSHHGLPTISTNLYDTHQCLRDFRGVQPHSPCRPYMKQLVPRRWWTVHQPGRLRGCHTALRWDFTTALTDIRDFQRLQH